MLLRLLLELCFCFMTGGLRATDPWSESAATIRSELPSSVRGLDGCCPATVSERYNRAQLCLSFQAQNLGRMRL